MKVKVTFTWKLLPFHFLFFSLSILPIYKMSFLCFWEDPSSWTFPLEKLRTTAFSRIKLTHFIINDVFWNNKLLIFLGRKVLKILLFPDWLYIDASFGNLSLSFKSNILIFWIVMRLLTFQSIFSSYKLSFRTFWHSKVKMTWNGIDFWESLVNSLWWIGHFKIC